MKVPIYVLGLLIQHGPQHGYQLKKIISERISDFTLIKLPTIYYHLEQMNKKGWIDVRTEQAGNRPQKSVYSINAQGKKQFNKMMLRLTDHDYRVEFENDALLFFMEFVDKDRLVTKMQEKKAELGKVITYIESHQIESNHHIPPERQRYTDLIFQHHLKHYHAELEWVEEAIKVMTD